VLDCPEDAEAEEQPMSAVVNESIWAQWPRRKLTVEDYHHMAEAGIFGPEERVELVEGELLQMSPIGYAHANTLSRLNLTFTPKLGDRAIAWVQNPIRLAKRSEPQPDFALLRYRPKGYDRGLPAANDILLLVEIADKSLRYERSVKAPLYARHAIPEYWIVNLTGRVVEVHRDPDPAQGVYRDIQTLAEGRLAPLHFPDIGLDVRELLS
jgi:Uma2 family endonuclease